MTFYCRTAVNLPLMSRTDSRPVHIHISVTPRLSQCSTPVLTLLYRARQLYKNTCISMLFLFPVKDGKLSTGVNATFDASCYG